MLRFVRPGSIAQSLIDTYRYLCESLVPMVGYPLYVTEVKGSRKSGKSAIRDPNGSMKLRLAMPEKSSREVLLVIPASATEDKYCRMLASRFAKQCRRICMEYRRSWDIKAHLIRQEQFLWDDVLLSITHAGNQKYNVLDILSSVRESLLFRYEGEFTETGILVSWNWHTLKNVFKDLNCSILKFKRPFDLREHLARVKAMHMLSDGSNSLLVATREGLCTHWVSLPTANTTDIPPNWELVPPKFHILHELIHGRDIVLTATRRNDLYFFTKEHVLKWSHKRWHRVSGPSLESILVRYLPDSAARTLTGVLVDLSSKNQGALFAIAHDPAKLVVGASPGLRQQFSGRYLFDLASVNTIAFCRLAAIDGCTIIDSEGHVVSAGVILDIPEDFTSAGEGARTAAASFASTFGLAVKVSHDGPITVFEDGVVIRQMA